MAWTALSVETDLDKTDVGTATVVWDQGGPDEYTYSRRVELKAEKLPLFMADAAAAKDAELARRVRNGNLVTTLQSWIDANL